MNVYYMVMGNDKPNFKHTTLISAKNEAERLARLHPGQIFIVLQAVGSAVVCDIKWEEFDSDEVPF